MVASKKSPTTKENQAAERPQQALSPFQRLQSEVDRLFEEFGALDWRHPFSGSAFDVKWPRFDQFGISAPTDMVEKDGAYEVTVEMPGMDKKNVEIKLSDGMLVITGEKTEEREDKEYHLSERHFGSVRRTFSLPQGIDQDKIEARFSKGVLTVVLPKNPEAAKSTKRINIKAA